MIWDPNPSDLGICFRKTCNCKWTERCRNTSWTKWTKNENKEQRQSPEAPRGTSTYQEIAPILIMIRAGMAEVVEFLQLLLLQFSAVVVGLVFQNSCPGWWSDTPWAKAWLISRNVHQFFITSYYSENIQFMQWVQSLTLPGRVFSGWGLVALWAYVGRQVAQIGKLTEPW